MIGVLSHDSALQGYTGLGITWANEMIFVMNHAAGAGLIARPVDQQSSVLPLYHGCPLLTSGFPCNFVLSEGMTIGRTIEFQVILIIFWL